MAATAPRLGHARMPPAAVQVAVLHPPDLPMGPDIQTAHPEAPTPGLQWQHWRAAPTGLHRGQFLPPDILIVRDEWFDPHHLDRPARQRSLMDLRLALPTTAWLIGWTHPGEAALSAFDALQIRGALHYPGDDSETVLRAARAVLAGELWFSHEVLQALYLRTLAAREHPTPPRAELTRQEHAMLGLMHRGLSPREIGRSLGLSRSRVQRGLAHALEKHPPW